MKSKLIIAIDGPAAAGKGTLARRLAHHFGLPHLDTGLLYRAVARRMLDEGADPMDGAAAEAAARALDPAETERGDLRTPEVDRAASLVAAEPRVRAALRAFQRQFASARGAVMDGRDIGTVIFPDAPVKLFVTARPEARAERRFRELAGRGIAADEEAVAAEIAERDAQDENRPVGPLRRAEDALLIDTTGLDPDQVFAAALEKIAARFASHA
ncbi:MAG TPA: (d)CMP kinase [Acetobacteraceae bacterium]|nr:(d)CMP kinase [Acetobacteraceae bacterium]